MRLLILIPLCLWATLLAAQSADEIAIREVCARDTESYLKADFEAWKTCWHHADDAVMFATAQGSAMKGWGEIEENLQARFANLTFSSEMKLAQKDFVISINGNHAYVHFTQEMIFPETFGGQSIVNKTYEVRNLRKVDGAWRFYSQVTTPVGYERTEHNAVDKMNNVAGLLLRMERPEAAAGLVTLVAETFPDHPSGHWGRGFLALQRKDKAQALKNLEKAIALFDGDPPPSLQELRKQAEALE